MAAVKLTGAEAKRFYKDRTVWGADDGSTWVEEEAVEVDGVEVAADSFDPDSITDTAVVKITGGYLVNPPDGVNDDYVTTLRAWLRKQSARQILVEAPADKLEEITKAIKALGGKVVV